MLANLDIQPTDEIIEFAPGLGVNASLTLQHQPTSYIGIERDETAAQQVRNYLNGSNRLCQVGVAEDPGLPGLSATVVYGEAMLTMQTPDNKVKIIREAARLLKLGGRYGIHELCLHPDDLSDVEKAKINQALSEEIRVGARPFTVSEWKLLLEEEGFTVASHITAPMHRLEPRRLIQDEGLSGFLLFVWNVARNSTARRRVLGMRAIFRNYGEYLFAVTMVGVKHDQTNAGET